MKIYQEIYLVSYIRIFLIIFSLINISSTTTCLKAEETYLKPMQIDATTKPEDEGLNLPTNPFQIVEMIRRANSMNDATKPSDAIDEALKAFDSIEYSD